MRRLLLALLCVASAQAADFSDHTGLELWSLHVISMRQGWRAALDEAKALGFRYVEGSAAPDGVSAEDYKAQLASRDLRMVSMGFSYENLSKDLEGCVQSARQYGVRHVMVAWIPHSGDHFTEAEARKAAEDFNRWGAAFRAAGIVFTYHPHGYEFRPGPGGTLFELIVAATRPADVSFEMDVFWVTHGGADPLALLRRYPDRWRMMHVKDIRKGAPTGIFTGHAPSSDDVAVGTGQVNWPAVLGQAKKDGIEWYFIEDESDAPTEHIPQSLAYLKSLHP